MQDPAPLRDKMDRKISELMDLNQRITTILRDKARDFETIGGTYQVMAGRAYEISHVIAELAAVAAANTGDIIIADFGLVLGDNDDDDEDFDEEDEDE